MALWAIGAPEELAEDVRRALVAPATEVLVSVVSSWEVAIKRAIGKLAFGGALGREAERHRFELLPITHEHAAAVEQLPPVHRDPFDRLLVAQAVVEGATIVTRDRTIPRYAVDVLPA